LYPESVVKNAFAKYLPESGLIGDVRKMPGMIWIWEDFRFQITPES
jgi:hypothetical protein